MDRERERERERERGREGGREGERERNACMYVHVGVKNMSRQ